MAGLFWRLLRFKIHAAGTRHETMRLGHYIFPTVVAMFAALPVNAACAQTPVHVEEEVIQLDPAHTGIDFTLVGKLHNTNGRFALKRGTIRIDPSTGDAWGEIVIDAATEDSSEDLRDAITRHAVLEVERYPEIIFSPRRIQGVRGSQDDFYGEMGGLMQLHGGMHEITVPLHGHVTGDRLTAACEFLVPYTEWGLESPNLLSASQIIQSTRTSRSQFVTKIFPIFAYMLPALRKIPPNLFWVSDLVDMKVEGQGRITWAPRPEARTNKVIVSPATQVKNGL
jgi:polyisoprenoid-binding protein YceI